MWQSLPVELKIEILNLCSGSDKVNFGIAIGVEQSLISNKDIWREVTVNEVNDHYSEFVKCQRYLGAHTRKLTFMGLKEYEEIEISKSLLHRICKHCPALEDLTMRENFTLDSSVIKFSRFPQTIKTLRLINISIRKVSKVRDKSGTTSLSRIKKDLPLLEKFHLRHPWYLVPYDHRAILSENQIVPQLEIEEDDFYYTMIHVKDERVSGYDEEERQRQIDKLYNELIAPYYYERLGQERLYNDLVALHHFKKLGNYIDEILS